jgi:hypothetical protein
MWLVRELVHCTQYINNVQEYETNTNYWIFFAHAFPKRNLHEDIFRQLICTLSTLHLTETYKHTSLRVITSQRYIQKFVEGVCLLTQYRYNFSENKMLWIMVVTSSKLYFLW